jgi:hypothetical protein
MVSARITKTLSAEESLAETCNGTVSDGPSDVLSVGDEDDDTYSNFGPETARKIKKNVHHLSSDTESRSAKQQGSDNKMTFMKLSGGARHDKNKNVIPNLRMFWRKLRGERDMNKHMLQKISGGGQGK